MRASLERLATIAVDNRVNSRWRRRTSESVAQRRIDATEADLMLSLIDFVRVRTSRRFAVASVLTSIDRPRRVEYFVQVTSRSMFDYLVDRPGARVRGARREFAHCFLYVHCSRRRVARQPLFEYNVARLGRRCRQMFDDYLAVSFGHRYATLNYERICGQI